MDIRAGGLRRLFDAIVIPDQAPRDIIDGYTNATVRPEYRGGIGEAGVEALSRFVSEGGTLITLGAASDLAIDRLPLPVRDLKRSLRRDQHFAPGTILRIQVDTSHPIGFGMLTIAPGVKWNLTDTWVLVGNVSVPLTKAGLTTAFTPYVGIDYSLER